MVLKITYIHYGDILEIMLFKNAWRFISEEN